MKVSDMIAELRKYPANAEFVLQSSDYSTTEIEYEPRIAIEQVDGFKHTDVNMFVDSFTKMQRTKRYGRRYSDKITPIVTVFIP